MESTTLRGERGAEEKTMTSEDFKKLAARKFAEYKKVRSVPASPKEYEFIEVEVINPYYPGKAREYFNLNEETLLKAEREGKMLRFNWDHGNSMFSPAQWRDGAQMSLHEFKYAGQPMRLIGNFLVRE